MSNEQIEIGCPLYFSPDRYLDVVEQMISADEVETAIWMMDNMPAYYRDNVPARAIEMRKRLLQRFFTTLDYARDGAFQAMNADECKAMLNLERAQLAYSVVKKLNDKHHYPHIYELAAGSYWLPQALMAAALKFTYYGSSLNEQMKREAAGYLYRHWEGLKDKHQKSIFICYEMIEHLQDPGEIYHHYVKAGLDADYVLLSTPHGVFNGGMPDWFDRDLGHLRTYTPREFGAFAQKYWPDYQWTLFDGPVMCLCGEKK